jgi:hypothetical protein
VHHVNVDLGSSSISCIAEASGRVLLDHSSPLNSAGLWFNLPLLLDGTGVEGR